jgi:hypothetical protein
MLETAQIALLTGGGLGLVALAGLVARPRINEAARVGNPVTLFTVLLVTALLAAVGVGLGLCAMAKGWEPFDAARLALPWPYRSPDPARRLGLVLSALAVLGLEGFTARQAILNSPGVALASLACLLVLGAAAANPIVFPVLAVLAVIDWGHSINLRARDNPMNWVTILRYATGWGLVAAGALAEGSIAAGTLIGAGAFVVLGTTIKIGVDEGIPLALETLVCGSLQAGSYGLFSVVAAVFLFGAAAMASPERSRDRERRR